MNTWITKVGMRVVAVVLAAGLYDCGGGGQGRVAIQVFFGGNGSGQCNRIVLDVDLAAAGAVIARNINGTVQCSISDILDAAGCDGTFRVNPDESLTATIICAGGADATTDLFNCLFETADVADLQADTQATCNDVGSEPICVSETEDPGSCEICDNGQDDDDNGDTDCDDPNCENSPMCGSSTTTTSSTSTTENETTTTTLPSGAKSYIVTWDLETATAPVGALQWTTDHSSASGTFLGTGQSVDCTANNSLGALFAPNYRPDVDKLTLGLIALSPFSAPTTLVSCTFSGDAGDPPPVAGDFVVLIEDSTDSNGEPIEVEIGVTVEPVP